MTTRRDFLRAGVVTAAATCAPGLLRATTQTRQTQPLFSGVGITARLERAEELKQCGADFIVESVANFLVPDQPDSVFLRHRELAAAAPLPVLGCNSFLRDRRLRCTGPDADHPRVLAFAETAFRRLREAGGEYIVFGSNTARRIPADWPKEKADEQFIALLRAMGPLAERHQIMVAVEAQQTSECNYLNHIGEVTHVVAAANHPSIRVLADLYHMARMKDTPDDLARAMPWVGVVELAEKENRTLPGVAGDDFRPCFAVLAAAGFRGRADIEGSGSTAQLEAAFVTVKRQAAEAMAQLPRRI